METGMVMDLIMIGLYSFVKAVISERQLFNFQLQIFYHLSILMGTMFNEFKKFIIHLISREQAEILHHLLTRLIQRNDPTKAAIGNCRNNLVVQG